jgi:peptidoglycan/xylan/chitin deacetylase (PgdA/CDA1 family)
VAANTLRDPLLTPRDGAFYCQPVRDKLRDHRSAHVSQNENPKCTIPPVSFWRNEAGFGLAPGWLKSTGRGLMASRNGWRLVRAVAGRPGVIVLTYHRVRSGEVPFRGADLAVFRRQMSWVRENCTVIAPEDLTQSLQSSDRLRPPVLVTFDDGYRDFHDHAYPVLAELGIPCLVFLATSFMDNGGLLWGDTLWWGVFHSRRTQIAVPWHESPMSLTEPAGRQAFARAALAHLKQIPDSEKEASLRWLLRELGRGDEGPVAERQMMNWDEVRATMGMARFGGHTHTHPILSRVDGSRIEEEIRLCRDRIASETGVAPRFFAYPNGRQQDFTPEAKEALVRHGFEVAFTTIEGVNGPETDRLELRRFSGRGPIPQMAWLRTRRT